MLFEKIKSFKSLNGTRDYSEPYLDRFRITRQKYMEDLRRKSPCGRFKNKKQDS